MLRMRMSWVVNRPAEDVWKVVTNFDHWAKASISGGEWRHTPEGATVLGTIVESSRKIFGRTRTLHRYVVTDFEPNRLFGMTDKFPGFPLMAQHFTFEPTPEGTRVTRAGDLDLGRARFLEPVLRLLLGRTWPIEGAAMIRLAEAGG
jgi:hypothetical protein